jgi:hypothetical protein
MSRTALYEKGSATRPRVHYDKRCRKQKPSTQVATSTHSCSLDSFRQAATHATVFQGVLGAWKDLTCTNIAAKAVVYVCGRGHCEVGEAIARFAVV